MSFNAVMKPHMKNSVVTMAIAFLSVTGAAATVAVWRFTFAIAIGTSPPVRASMPRARFKKIVFLGESASTAQGRQHCIRNFLPGKELPRFADPAVGKGLYDGSLKE